MFEGQPTPKHAKSSVFVEFQKKQSAKWAVSQIVALAGKRKNMAKKKSKNELDNFSLDGPQENTEPKLNDDELAAFKDLRVTSKYAYLKKVKRVEESGGHHADADSNGQGGKNRTANRQWRSPKNSPSLGPMMEGSHKWHSPILHGSSGDQVFAHEDNRRDSQGRRSSGGRRESGGRRDSGARRDSSGSRRDSSGSRRDSNARRDSSGNGRRDSSGNARRDSGGKYRQRAKSQGYGGAPGAGGGRNRNFSFDDAGKSSSGRPKLLLRPKSNSIAAAQKFSLGPVRGTVGFGGRGRGKPAASFPRSLPPSPALRAGSSPSSPALRGASPSFGNGKPLQMPPTVYV